MSDRTKELDGSTGLSGLGGALPLPLKFVGDSALDEAGSALTSVDGKDFVDFDRVPSEGFPAGFLDVISMRVG